MLHISLGRSKRCFQWWWMEIISRRLLGLIFLHEHYRARAGETSRETWGTAKSCLKGQLWRTIHVHQSSITCGDSRLADEQASRVIEHACGRVWMDNCGRSAAYGLVGDSPATWLGLHPSRSCLHCPFLHLRCLPPPIYVALLTSPFFSCFLSLLTDYS